MTLKVPIFERLYRNLINKKTVVYLSILTSIVLVFMLEYTGLRTGTFLNRVMVSATPLLFATLGEILVERSGVLNLGIEGMMATGAVLSVAGAFATGNPWTGAAIGMLGGVILAFIFGVIAIHLQGMQVPAGLGLFMLGLGLSGIIGTQYGGKVLPYRFKPIPIPLLEDVPVIGNFLFQHEFLVYIALILVPVMWFILSRTRIGLNIKTIGENPATADSAGINVFRYRYFCVMVGGALAGLGGAFLSLAWAPGWTEGMVAGRGWIVIALVIFSLWRPLGALLGSLIFGGLFAIQFELQGLGFPVYIIGMGPYAGTLVALIIVCFFAKRLGAPSSLGVAYKRE